MLALLMTLMLSYATSASADDCAGPAGCTKAARSARAFTESVGVNTHLGYGDQPYVTAWPTVRDRLVELGVRHIRDTSHRDGTRLTDVVPHMQELGRLGIKGNLLAGDPAMRYGGGRIDEHLAWVKKNVLSFTESLEGPNEYNHNSNDPNWQQTLRSYQCQWARKIRADPTLAAKTVIGPSPGGVGFDNLGDLTSCLDVGNTHPYPGARSPDRTNHGDLSVHIAAAREISGSKPIWFTESGYHNALACVCGHDPVSEAASGTYIPRMFMENFRRGVPRTYAYELIDGRPDPQRTDPESNFGLLRNDGTRKPAFTTLRNLLGILADTGSASGELSYSLQCTAGCSVPLRHVLLRKSTGAYYVVVWPESSAWDARTRTEVHSSPLSAELQVFSPVHAVEVFDPARSQKRVSRSTSTSQRVELTDGMLVFKVTPPAGKAGRALVWTADRAVRQLERMGSSGLRSRSLVRVSARAALSGRYRVRLQHGGATLAQGARSFDRAGLGRIGLRLRPRAIRALPRTARSRLRVSFVDRAGRRTSMSRPVWLVR